jgi:hypothetical protein
MESRIPAVEERRVPRLSVRVAVVVVALLITARPSDAGEGSASHTDEPVPGYASSVSTSTSTSGAASRTTRRTYSRPASVTCQAIDGTVGVRRYERLGPITTLDLPTAPTEAGAWYARYCGDSAPAAGCPPWSTPSGCLGVPSDRWGFGGVSWWSPAEAFGMGAPVDISEVAADAYKFLPIPKTSAGLNPPGTAGVPALVNLETWLWIDPGAWAPQYSEVEVCCPSVVVRVAAEPRAVAFDMGDGSAVRCPGGGVPYDPTRPAAGQHTDCSYTYARSSAAQVARRFMVTAAVEWTASWSVSGAAPPGGGALPPTSQAGNPTPVRVAEIQTLNTNAG